MNSLSEGYVMNAGIGIAGFNTLWRGACVDRAANEANARHTGLSSEGISQYSPVSIAAPISPAEAPPSTAAPLINPSTSDTATLFSAPASKAAQLPGPSRSKASPLPGASQAEAAPLSASDAAQKAKGIQDDLQAAQQIYLQMAADRQKWMTEIWKTLQDTQTAIFSIIQSVLLNREKTSIKCAEKWAAALGDYEYKE
jgi:hypothetical protein